MVTLRCCVVSCMELAIKMGEGLTPSRFVVRASFPADISGVLGGDIGCAATFRVLSISAGGCGGES